MAAEFAYNNSVQASTGFTPFYLNHGRHPHTPLSLTIAQLQPSTKDTNPAALDFVGRFQASLSKAKDALHRAQQRQQKYADKVTRLQGKKGLQSKRLTASLFKKIEKFMKKRI